MALEVGSLETLGSPGSFSTGQLSPDGRYLSSSYVNVRSPTAVGASSAVPLLSMGAGGRLEGSPFRHNDGFSAPSTPPPIASVPYPSLPISPTAELAAADGRAGKLHLDSIDDRLGGLIKEQGEVGLAGPSRQATFTSSSLREARVSSLPAIRLGSAMLSIDDSDGRLPTSPAELIAVLERTRRHRDGLAADVTRLQAHASSLAAELLAAREGRTRAEASCRMLAGKVDSLEREVAVLRRYSGAQEGATDHRHPRGGGDDHAGLAGDVSSMRSELQQVKQALQAVAAERARLASERDAAVADASAVLRAVDEVTRQNESLHSEIAALKGQLSAVTAEHEAEHRRQASSLRSQLADRESQFASNLKTTEEHYRQQLDAAHQAALAQRQDSAAAHADEVHQLQGRLDAAVLAAQQAEAKLLASETAAAGLRSRLAAESQRGEQAQTDVRTLERECESLRDQLTSAIAAQAGVPALQAEVVSLQAALERSSTDVAAARLEAGEARSKATAAVDELMAQQASYRMALETLEQLQSEVQRARGDLGTAQSLAAAAAGERDTVAARYREADAASQAEVMSLRSQLATAAEEAAHARMASAVVPFDAAEVIRGLRTALQDASAQLEQARAALSLVQEANSELAGQAEAAEGQAHEAMLTALRVGQATVDGGTDALERQVMMASVRRREDAVSDSQQGSSAVARLRSVVAHQNATITSLTADRNGWQRRATELAEELSVCKRVDVYQETVRLAVKQQQRSRHAQP